MLLSRRRSRRTFSLLSFALALFAIPASASAATTATTTFTTAGTSTFTVPVGVTDIEATAIGASGGRACFGSGTGGEGAKISADIPVSGGQSLSVEVGGLGADLGGCEVTVPWSGGLGGGGDSGYEAGGPGGGASLISIAPYAPKFSAPMLVAGGGGGQGDDGAAGGNAGAAGGKSAGAGGGGAGTALHGGASGQVGSCAGGVPGIPGSLALGGSGGSIYEYGGTTGGGGGGGGGYFGGGGGAACPDPFEFEKGGGGGGGGGSSFVTSSATGVSGPTVTTASASVSITYGVPLAKLSGSGLSGGGHDFATQAQGTLSTAEVLTLANEGSAPLVVSGLSLSGADPDDYLLTNRCQQPVSSTPGSNSCQIAVRFSPEKEGPSAAELAIASNSSGGELTLGLSGSGGPLPEGPAGEIELVTCKKVKKKGARKPRQHCKAKLVSGPVTFKTQGASKARLFRGGHLIADGWGRGTELALNSEGLDPGSYKLLLISHHHGRASRVQRFIVLS